MHWSLTILSTTILSVPLMGCGQSAATTGAKPGGPGVKALPAEYRVLAKTVGLDMHASPSDFKDNVEPSEVIANLHAAVIDLRGIQSQDPDITYITAHGCDACTELVTRLERIAALPKPPTQGALFVESFVHGWYGNFVTPYLNSADAEEKQKAIVTEAEAGLSALEKAFATGLLLPKVAQKYAAPPTSSAGRIAVDIDESWVAGADWFRACNTGPALEDCTIQVQLTGIKGDTIRNVHFVESWPANTWMYGRYESGQELLGRKVGTTTVALIQKAEVSLWSPKFSTVLTYVYQGAEKDKDYQSRCQEMAFTGTYKPFVKGVLWDTQRGVDFTMDGHPLLPKCRVDVTFRRGSQSKGWFWEIEHWAQGEKKSFGTRKGELNFDPEAIDLEISFPGKSAYRHNVTLKLE